MSMLSGVLAMGRTQAEALMTSTCSITRADSGPTLNEETGQYEATPEAVYAGPCRVRYVSTVVTEVDLQSQMLAVQDAILSLPVSTSADVAVGDEALITANASDSGLVGTRFRIKGVHAQTNATARRFPVEVIA